jgi:rhamnosyltransferase
LIDLSELATVTVTYNPNHNMLRTQLLALPANSLKIIVDNASPPETRKEFRILRDIVPNMHLVENADNVGLAVALNQGVNLARALRPHATWCLLLDQDSEPQPGSIPALLAAMENLLRRGIKVGSIGPLLVDADIGLSHGFHQATHWRWRRVYPPAGSAEPVPCTNLNGSGTLMPMELFAIAGGLDESFFIDHIDTEWSFRLLAHGYTLWGIPQALFRHRMGQRSLRYWLFGWRLWPHRSPLRHYYLFRNALWLMKRSYVPFVWKFWASVKLTLTLVVHMLFDPERRAQLLAMIQGLRDGFKPTKTRTIQP